MHQNVSSPPSFLSIQTLTEMPRTSTQITQPIIYLPLYPHIDDSGATPLVQAVKNGHVHVVRALLDAGMLSLYSPSFSLPPVISLSSPLTSLQLQLFSDALIDRVTHAWQSCEKYHVLVLRCWKVIARTTTEVPDGNDTGAMMPGWSPC